jgi:hypothetical protein
MVDVSHENSSRAKAVVALSKDFVSLLRDGALFALALLLIAFPSQFNSILVNAGFEEGSFVGFKWKSKLIENDNALKSAHATIANLQARNDELLVALQDTNAKLSDPVFLSRLTKLEEENRILKNSTTRVQKSVTQAIDSNAPLVEKALSSSAQRLGPPSTYLVGLQTVGVGDDESKALNAKLESAGYRLDLLTYSYPAGNRPSWFAIRSTVFYYSAASSSGAQELAKTMRSLTGQDFAVQRGAGLGVDPSERDRTLFVHYLKK